MSIPLNRVVLFGVFLFTYAFLVYLLELFGVMKYLTGIIGLPVVSYGAWYFIFAKEPKESMAEGRDGKLLRQIPSAPPQAVAKTTIGILRWSSWAFWESAVQAKPSCSPRPATTRLPSTRQARTGI